MDGQTIASNIKISVSEMLTSSHMSTSAKSVRVTLLDSGISFQAPPFRSPAQSTYSNRIRKAFLLDLGFAAGEAKVRKSEGNSLIARLQVVRRCVK
jgi:hypothetical protein